VRHLADLTDAELVVLKIKFSAIQHKMEPGETSWCDHLTPWPQFEKNIDDTLALIANINANGITSAEELMRPCNPELYDLIFATFIESP